MSDEEHSKKPPDPVVDQVAAATDGALQGALNTLAAAAVERDRILDQFREQKERLEFQLQQQRAHAMNYVEQARAETQQRTGGPAGQSSGQADAENGLNLSPDQQFIAGVKMLIYQDTRPFEVSTETQKQAALLLLDALKKIVHQEINVLFERAQAQETAKQEAAKQEAASPATAEQSAAEQSAAGKTEPDSGTEDPAGNSKDELSKQPDGSSSAP
ncbi:hypothetical protein NUH88_11515 [Nisaea acidiphila]|uniref:Uncharacterized protein n=1 Tax=Nisaea acidiphila TaxID=1862145 RepID=A0A9J7ALJ9_9PROT|nr:hypothetical protein [Nisaea acidiphila]UUX48047.1 hypothetical protein NUH88_11515 [Nisaea acidiphila]